MALIWPILSMSITDLFKKILGLSLENPEEDKFPHKIYVKCKTFNDEYMPYPLHETDVKNWESFLAKLVQSIDPKVASLWALFDTDSKKAVEQSITRREIGEKLKNQIIGNLDHIVMQRDLYKKLGYGDEETILLFLGDKDKNIWELEKRELVLFNRLILESIFDNEFIKFQNFCVMEISITRNGVRILTARLQELFEDGNNDNEKGIIDMGELGVLHSKSDGLIIRSAGEEEWEKRYPVTEDDEVFGVTSSVTRILLTNEKREHKNYAVIEGAKQGIQYFCDRLYEYFIEYNIDHVHFEDFTYMFIPGSLNLTVFLANKLEDN